MKYVKDLVSVVIPTYKRSDKLFRALDSVLGQSYSNIELLLVNDNEPNDNYSKLLEEKVSKYKNDKRFKLITQEKHINGAAARNAGIIKSVGEYIAFLDDDDWWEKNKIEEQVKVLKTLDETWGGVSCKYTQYDGNLKVVGKTSKYKDGYIYKDILYLLSDVATGTLLLRREALDKCGYFDVNLKRHQDLQLLVNFTYHYKLKEVNQFLFCIDISDTNNRPSPENIIKYKEDFFKSVDNVIQTLNDSEKKCMYSIHKFEVGYVYIKNKKYIQGIKYIFNIFNSFKTFKIAMSKTIKRFIQLLRRK